MDSSWSSLSLSGVVLMGSRASEVVFYTGLRGHGKTLSAVRAGLKWAQEHRKSAIVTNLAIDVKKAHDYALSRGWRHLSWLCRHGRIVLERNWDRVVAYDNSVVILDEGGIFFDSRDSMDKEQKEKLRRLFADVILSRKANIDLLITAQDFSQVDIKLRRLADHMYHVQRFTIPGLDIPMFLKTEFDYAGYEEFINKKTFKNWLKNRTSFFPEVKPYDKRMFGIYDTYQRLDGSNTIEVQELVQGVDSEAISGGVLRQVIVPEKFDFTR